MNDYVAINTVVLCRALQEKVPFEKSVRIAAGALAEVLVSKHDGMIPGSKKKMEPEKVFKGSADTLVVNAYRACPAGLPAEVKSQVKTAIENKK